MRAWFIFVGACSFYFFCSHSVYSPPCVCVRSLCSLSTLCACSHSAYSLVHSLVRLMWHSCAPAEGWQVIAESLLHSVGVCRASTRCHGVCRLLGLSEKEGMLCLVMKLYSSSLSQLAQQLPGNRLPKLQLLQYACQVQAQMPHQQHRP